eukprot:TRINITY_DN25819_c0_g1_i1.p1 TRINITY_DN25819_c0_g1~~TRINITY_DN25819_c0_g1_i1.p1  ORF type:complete len:432 (-),score=65.61 TRINITY_DN25819_c0_g1_i1:149-1444(-)
MTSVQPATRARSGGSSSWDVVITNARLATMSSSCQDRPYGCLGKTTDELCALAIQDGCIAWMGTMADLPAECLKTTALCHNVEGAWVTPGLVDCHTHIVYGGDRAEEWELKLRGASYEEVAKAGGGIVNTVDGTRAASVEDLVEGASDRVKALLAEGVTCLEIKSGYGLSEADERKQLQAAREIGNRFDVTVRTTFLGAHAVPREFKEAKTGGPDAYIDEVVRMLPVLSREGLVDMVDAFTETIGFSVAQTERVFNESRRLNLPVRLHGDQLNDLGCGALAAKYDALSCDHCEYTSESSVKAMAAKGVVAVLLPSSNYFIKETKRPPVAQFRANKVQMAIASNSNPGSSPCSSLLLTMNMACTLFGLTPEEALYGATRYGAQAMGLGATHGTLEVGKAGDIAVWNVKSPCELAYHLGLNKLIACYKAGKRR